MPRQKCKRAISYRPPCCHFRPQNEKNVETISLLAEEVEALYLMDLMELYQEEAALKMGVSRPTFARIIKSARHKVALALLLAHPLHLQRQKEHYTIALCSDSETSPYTALHSKGKYIHLFTLKEQKIIEHTTIPNLLHTQNLKPALYLSQLFTEHRINLYLVRMIGEGFKSTLTTKGIQILLKEQISQKELEALW